MRAENCQTLVDRDFRVLSPERQIFGQRPIQRTVFRNARRKNESIAGLVRRQMDDRGKPRVRYKARRLLPDSPADQFPICLILSIEFTGALGQLETAQLGRIKFLSEYPAQPNEKRASLFRRCG